jgi:hypothetical protein
MDAMNEKQAMVDRWAKIASLAYDMSQEDGLLEAFQVEDMGPAKELLAKYDLTVKDFFLFRADLESTLYRGWWLGFQAGDFDIQSR